ncbi:Txe/YoeB family addiction module toxin [Methylobacter sp.]|uniref:Txe/YoeB family addiction module toxin n=1 Tax=Methylobacter sp. TaxID=2051955 RepID=UPI002488402E|nr:Txe/YoeB family addiction module toxin [Methylobacter sp.]MDI1276885.1 Txe/YoeB family addiction module toxin [Methylobacter sp.]MDI1357551.1 Txe/YoeB family addiction module toxin [Methylobacter sp.]
MISFEQQGWEDYLFWQQTDKTKIKRINQLIRDIQRDPFDGIGKPEALRHGLTGLWSRRIDDEHRLIYSVNGKKIEGVNKYV